MIMPRNAKYQNVEDQSCDDSLRATVNNAAGLREFLLRARNSSCEQSAFTGSDGTSRATCYLNVRMKLLSLNSQSHSVEVAGNIAMFWYDASFMEANPDCPTGDVACGDNPVTYELKDNGSNMPINPNFPFTAQLEMMILERKPSKLLYNETTSIVWYDFHFKAKLGANLDLRNFPFDRFKIPIVLNLRTSVFHLSPLAFQAVPDKWGLRDPVTLTFSQSVADEFRPRKGYECTWDCSDWKPVVRISLQRRPHYYLFNMFLPLFLLILISALVYAIPANNISTRTSLSVTLLLTQFALKSSGASGLPTVPYSTWLDKYSLFATAMIALNLFLAATESIVTGHDPDYNTYFDCVVGVVFAVSWTAVHVRAFKDIERLFKPWEEVAVSGGRAPLRFVAREVLSHPNP